MDRSQQRRLVSWRTRIIRHAAEGGTEVNRIVVLLSLTLLLGCESTGRVDRSKATQPSPVLVTVALIKTTVSVSQPIIVRVRLQNNGKERVVFGTTSSSCWWLGRVLVAGKELLMSNGRGCAWAFTEHALDPGTTYTDVWMWDSSVRGEDHRSRHLPAGEYQILGAAGEYRSEPVTVHVVADK